MRGLRLPRAGDPRQKAVSSTSLTTGDVALAIFIRILLSLAAVALGLALYVGIMMAGILTINEPADQAPAFLFGLSGVAAPIILMIWRDVGTLKARAESVALAAGAGLILLVLRMHVPALALAWFEHSSLASYFGGSLTLAILLAPLTIAFQLQTRFAERAAAPARL